MNKDNDFENWEMRNLIDNADEIKDEIEKILSNAKYDDKKFYDLLEMERELTRREN